MTRPAGGLGAVHAGPCPRLLPPSQLGSRGVTPTAPGPSSGHTASRPLPRTAGVSSDARPHGGGGRRFWKDIWACRWGISGRLPEKRPTCHLTQAQPPSLDRLTAPRGAGRRPARRPPAATTAHVCAFKPTTRAGSRPFAPSCTPCSVGPRAGGAGGLVPRAPGTATQSRAPLTALVQPHHLAADLVKRRPSPSSDEGAGSSRQRGRDSRLSCQENVRSPSIIGTGRKGPISPSGTKHQQCVPRHGAVPNPKAHGLASPFPDAVPAARVQPEHEEAVLFLEPRMTSSESAHPKKKKRKRMEKVPLF